MSNLDEIKAYYRQVTAIDIGAVARELLGSRITSDAGTTIHLDCPLHASVSGKSLHVELDKQLWRCWGCGISGDVLHLVEMARHEIVTAGQSGRMSDTHRDARDWLAEKVGLPKLSHLGLSEEEIAAVEEAQARVKRARAVLTEATEWYHQQLLAHPEVQDWLRQQYAFTPEVFERFRIGYADLRGLRPYLFEAGFTPEDLLASGLFTPNETGDERQVMPSFANRVMFPYFSRGQVGYLIGRKTPWTPEARWEQGKYKKLQTYDADKRPWVAPGIENNLLYNEDLLLSRPAQVVITEGITDCIALTARGIPCISPVTTNIRQDDWARIIPALRGVKEVLICQDNELSGAGWKGALNTARQLEDAELVCRIAELPLDEAQQAARQELATRFGITEAVGARALEGQLADHTPEDREVARQLLDAAKVDICSFFVAGHSTADFTAVLQAAQAPVEYAIAQLPTEMTPRERQDAVESLIRGIARQPELEHDRQLKALLGKLGNAYRMGTLRSMLREILKEIDAAKRHAAQQHAVEDMGGVLFSNGRLRYYLVDEGIARESMKETPAGPVALPLETLSNFHIHVLREVLFDDGETHDDGTTISHSQMHGELIGQTWRKPFAIDSRAWGSNADLARHITAIARHRALFNTRHLDDIRLVSNTLSTDTREEVVHIIFGMHPTAGFVTPTLSMQQGQIIPTADLGIRVDVGAEYNKARHLDLLPCADDDLQSLLGHLLTDFVQLQPLRVTLPILAHAFLGPIAFHPAIMREFSPFTLFIAGSSGKGKTETARLAQCLWGDFTTKDKLAGWGTTPEMNRQEAARCRGGLWLIDDFKRQKIGHLQWTNALRVLTDYADLQSRKRATPGAKVITGAVIQAMLMVTGEDLPFNETSAMARSLIIEFDGQQRAGAQYAACMARQQDYRRVMAPFIAWWQQQETTYWLERLKEIRHGFDAFMTGEGLEADNTRRLASNAALSQLGLEAFWAFCYAVGVDPLTVAGSDLPAEYTGILQEILRTMITLVNDARPGESFINTLIQLLAAGRVRIRDRYIDDHDDHGVPIVGYYARNRNIVYLLTRLAMGAVRDAYKRGEDEPLYFSTSAIGKQLAEAEIILPEDISRQEFTHRIRIPGGGRHVNPEWAWRIDAERLTTLLNRYARENGESFV